MKGVIIGPISLIIGIIILKIFLPSWFVVLIMGTVTVGAVYYWVVRKTKTNEKLARKIAIVAIALFVLSTFLSLTEKKWPWLGEAINRLQIYASFWVTDRIDPGYDASGALELWKTKELQVKADIERQNKILRSLQKKIANGQELTQAENETVEKCGRKIEECQGKLETLRLSRPGKKKNAGTIDSVIPKIFLFGTIMFGAGIGLQAFTKKQRGGFFVGLGILILFAWLFLAIFAPEITAEKLVGREISKADKNKIYSKNQALDKAATVNLPASTSSQGIYTGVDYRAGQKIRLVQRQVELTEFSIVGRKTCELVISSDHTTNALVSGGLWLRPEQGKSAIIDIYVY